MVFLPECPMHVLTWSTSASNVNFLHRKAKHALGGILFQRLEVPHLSTRHRVHGSGDDALRSAKAELLCASRDLEGLLEYLKRLPVRDDLIREPALSGDGGDSHVGDVLSPHGVGLDEAVQLWKKETVGRMLLRKPVLRAAATTIPRVMLRPASYTSSSRPQKLVA